MIPPYGHRHRPVFGPALRLAFALPPSTWRARIGRPRTGRDRVTVDPETGVIEIRFGRHRVVTPLANVAAAHADGAGPPRRRTGAWTDPIGQELTFDSGGPVAVHIRFHRPVRGRGRAVHSAVAVTVEHPEYLVHRLTGCWTG